MLMDRKELASQGISKSAAEPKLFGLSSSLAGALTGILSVILISLLYRSIGFISLAIGFLFPGYLALEKINSLHIDMTGLSSFLIYYGVSCIPPAIIGVLIFSDRIKPRICGVILLIVYAISWLAFSFFFHIMAD